MNENNVTRTSCAAEADVQKAIPRQHQEINSNVEVISSAASDPAAAGSCVVLVMRVMVG